jgi:hypothetical protein
MRTALMLSLGVGATIVAAVFVGAAAANTGAPVFYDAHYPAPASSGPDGYDVGEGGAGEAGAADDAGGQAPPPPGSGSHGTPPTAAPRSGAPATPTPTPTAKPTPKPTPTPAPKTPTATPAPGPYDPAFGRAPGGPSPDATPPNAQEQQDWLAFQQIVRECMADAGQEYLYWEWWNLDPDASNRFPPMPADLTADQYAAWELALYGDSADGAADRWQDAGCWGYAVHVAGDD